MNRPDTRKIRILLADADAAFCVFVRYSLEQLGFEVTIAGDGADLVARFLPDRFDVVLVDIAMPFFDGIQVLRAVKQRSPTTPVIFLCDADYSQRAEDGIQEGAFGYLEKPLNDFAQLGHAITRAYETQTGHQATESRVALTPPNAPEPDAPITLLLRQLSEAALTQPLGVILQMFSTVGARLMQAPYGIVLLTQSGAESQVAGAHGFENLQAAARDLTERVGDLFTARVIAERKTICAPILSQPAESTSQQAIGVPLLAENQTLGALIIYPLVHVSPEDVRVAQLELGAAQCVLAIKLSRLREENARLTSIDAVTGMLKREPFLELADREFRRSWRYNQPITAIVVDVDNLAEINLKCGCTFGDQVLREVANACASIIRSVDLIGRYDGDAFALLLLMTESEGAQNVAERLRTEISAIQLANAPSPVQITASIGVCSYPRSGCTSIFDLLAVTQEAQRAARYRGVNQIIYG